MPKIPTARSMQYGPRPSLVCGFCVDLEWKRVAEELNRSHRIFGVGVLVCGVIGKVLQACWHAI